MTRADRVVAALAGLVVLATVLVGSVSPARASSSVRLYVHPSRQGICLADQVATYCHPLRWGRERAVDVLTAGSTYDRAYWDWPGGDPTYSYVGRALRDHRATLSYDRRDEGDSAAVSMASEAARLHGFIIRARLLGARQINSISHSYGSGVALAEAAQYGDVDALVLTGYLHRPSNPLVTAGNWQANLDPKFAGLGLDDGWLTTRPGARLYGFHSVTSDLDLVAVDETNKGLVSRPALLDFLGQRGVPAATNVSRSVAVPVLALVGQQDAIFCLNLPAAFDCADQAALAANEMPYYQSVTVASVPASGHDLALHPTGAGVSYETINAWLESVS
jgi:pimeloyl-ACP methyl ester carboxylesterase